MKTTTKTTKLFGNVRKSNPVCVCVWAPAKINEYFFFVSFSRTSGTLN